MRRNRALKFRLAELLLALVLVSCGGEAESQPEAQALAAQRSAPQPNAPDAGAPSPTPATDSGAAAPEPERAPSGDLPGHVCTVGKPVELGTTSKPHRAGDAERIDTRIAINGEVGLAAWALDEQTIEVRAVDLSGAPRGPARRVQIDGAHRMRILSPLADRFVLVTQHWCADSTNKLCAYGIVLDLAGLPQGKVDVDPLLGRPAELTASTAEELYLFRSHVHLKTRMLRYRVAPDGSLRREPIPGFGFELYEGGPLALFATDAGGRLLLHEQPPERAGGGPAILRTHPGNDRRVAAVPTRWDAAVFAARLEGDELAIIRGERGERPLLYRYDAKGKPVGRPTRIRRGELPPAPFDREVTVAVKPVRRGADLVRRTPAGDRLSALPLLGADGPTIRNGVVAKTPTGYLALLGAKNNDGRTLIAVPVQCSAPTN